MSGEGYSLEDRLQPDSFRDDPEVHFGIAESGQSPKEWSALPERLVARLVALGEAYELHHVSRIDIYSDTTFKSTQCPKLANEVQFLAEVVRDPALEEVFATLAQLLAQTSQGTVHLMVSGN